MNLIKPKKLNKGAKIALLSVSGDIKDSERIENAVRFFENEGFKVKVSDTTYKKDRYFAGSEEERIAALEDFFSDKSIDAIVCTRGGYGTIKLLDKINYTLIRKNPKIFVGYSDITALLAMFLKKAGLVTFHGAMASSDFGTEAINLFTKDSFFSTLEDKNHEFSATEELKTYKTGSTTGILWGGNLSTLASMAGLDFLPNEKFILFLEDLNEPVYKLDRMLTQLLNLKEFRKNLAGIALGKFSETDSEENLQKLLQETADTLEIPTCSGFEISHEERKLTLPIGLNCTLDANNGTLKLLESAFK